MRILKQRKQNRVTRRAALEGVPVLNENVELQMGDDDLIRVLSTQKRGRSIFERLRPEVSTRTYELDEFGTFVVQQVDSKRTVLKIVECFEAKYGMSRRESELAVVAFFKMLMQRGVVSVVVAKASSGSPIAKTVALFGALLLLALPGSAQTNDAAATMAAIRELAVHEGGRHAGSPGNLALEAAVAERFAASGFEHGEIGFDAPVLEPGTLTLDLGEQGRFTLDAMHPTLMRPGNFATHAFETRLVYMGQGGPEALVAAEGVSLDGAIAVMEYACGDEWLRLLRFGVKGFVFLEGEGPGTHQQAVSKVYTSEVSVPRFYAAGDDARRLRALCVDNAECAAQASAVPTRWHEGELRDLWVMIPGTGRQEHEVAVISAAMDANSVVPARAEGGQRAVNLHVLLKMLDELKERPPLSTVVLVAVNGRTQRYAGDRMLAWHLLAKVEQVEATRDNIASEMRLSRLYLEEYGKLRLEPVAEADRADLHVMMEVLGQLDAAQKVVLLAEAEAAAEDEAEAEAEAEDKGFFAGLFAGVQGLDDEAQAAVQAEPLDLGAVDADALQSAFDATAAEIRESYNSFFAKRGNDPAELAAAEKADTKALAALREMSLDAFMQKARRVQSVFEDERLLELWRSKLDESTGRRVYVKGELQDWFKSEMNKVMQEIMVVSSSELSEMADAARAARLEVLNAERDNLRSVLVIFNKLDIGVGRTRTQYRQIAVNDLQREMLREVVDDFLAKFKMWREAYDVQLTRDAENGAIRRALGTRRVAVVLSLELDGIGRRYGLSYHPHKKADVVNFDGFSRIAVEIAAQQVPSNAAPAYVDALSAAADRLPAHYFAFPESASIYMQMAGKTPALGLKTAYGGRGALFGPNDTVDRLDAEQVHQLGGSVLAFLDAIVRHEEALSPSNLKPMKVKGELWSSLVRTYSLEQFSGKPIPTTEVPGCLVTVYDRGRFKQPGPAIVNGDVINCFMGISDQSGNSYFYGLAEQGRMAPLAYLLDDAGHAVEMTVDKGRVQSSKQINTRMQRSPRITVPMFECREFVINDRTDPTLVSTRGIMVHGYWPKTGDGKSDPDKFGMHGGYTVSGQIWTHAATGPVGVYLYRKSRGFLEDNLMVITEQKRCVLNATPLDENGEGHPDGEGFASQDTFGPDFFAHAARDMSILNAWRGAEMKGVVNQLLDTFMADARARIAGASESLKANRHLDYLQQNYEALGNAVKAYGEIQRMNTDMLKAVVVYMALMLPFCFFLQKLLFGFKRLEHELAAFFVLFIGMYVLFRFIHPAFRIAMSPEAIFIAFVLGAIGVFTTSVLQSRFSGEMQVLLRGIGGIGESAAYGTVGQTALLIGVQNMRRRRVRTTLTTATIVLVVFTMLAFSSVSRTAKPTLINKADAAPYTGIFFHWPGAAPMDEDSPRVFEDLYAGRAEVQVRRVLTREDPWLVQRTSDPSLEIDVSAITGLPVGDVAVRSALALVEGEDFSAPDAREVMLTVNAADALQIGREDVGTATVRMMGEELVVCGLLSDRHLGLARDLNPNLPLVPMAQDKSKKSKEDKDSLEIQERQVTENMMDTAQLVVLPEALAGDFGAQPNMVSVIFPAGEALDLGAEISRVLRVTAAKLYIGSRDEFKLTADSAASVAPGVYYVGSSFRTAIGGLAKLLIPLIIAGSIILNTMLGTVYERKSEIAVFNAIGLNPTHIFLFFLAEAIVYSFIGSVGGYLIGQVLTVLLKSAGLIGDVNINFSSLMVVYAILFTMALVVLSTIYPGYVATRTAVPSGQRKWSMPDNDGNTMNVVFPFIYQPRLALGVMSYLQDYFEPLSETSSGDIIADLVDVAEFQDAEGRQMLSLRYRLALAPYDLGVTQDVTFTTQYDEVVNSYRLRMNVERVSGRDANWVTTNRPFLERLRKLLMRWRNVDPTRQAWFEAEGAKLFELPLTAAAGKEVARVQ